VLWGASHSPLFGEVFVRQRDQLAFTRIVNHLIADDALAGLRPMLFGSWVIRWSAKASAWNSFTARLSARKSNPVCAESNGRALRSVKRRQ